MPELPEVETTVRLIRPGLVGRTITGASVAWRRTVGERSFERRVVGARIASVRRRAKYFVIDLKRGGEPAGALVGHLRMTGRVLVQPNKQAAPDYAKVAQVAKELA